MRAFGDEGRTVLFAHPPFAEADEIADRVVVLNHGKSWLTAPVPPEGGCGHPPAPIRLRRAGPCDFSDLEGITEVEIPCTCVFD